MAAPKVKYFQDPLYGQIAVADPLLLGLIDSRAVQRLRQIRQLGVSHLTFLGAEHSRFSHSLGAMALMGRVLDHLAAEGLRLDAEARRLAQAGALLHDIGHCAYSHTLEAQLIGRHEAMGARLLREDPELRRLLGPRAGRLAALLEGRLPGREGPLLKDLLSSQLDVDRLDYLARDAHYTGVSSGHVDLGRIVASFTVSGGRLAVKERGLLAVEEYFLARYFMYWKVYYHKTSRAMELLLQAALEEARRLWRAGLLPKDSATPALGALLEAGGRVAVADFLDHDDSDVMVALKRWAAGPPGRLAGLCGRFLRRRKLGLAWEARAPAEDLGPRRRAAAEALLRRRRGGPGPWLVLDRLGRPPYDRKEEVMVTGPLGRRPLSRVSKVVRDIATAAVHARYYAPQEDLAAVQALLRRG